MQKALSKGLTHYSCYFYITIVFFPKAFRFSQFLTLRLFFCFQPLFVPQTSNLQCSSGSELCLLNLILVLTCPYVSLFWRSTFPSLAQPSPAPGAEHLFPHPQNQHNLWSGCSQVDREFLGPKRILFRIITRVMITKTKQGPFLRPLAINQPMFAKNFYILVVVEM